jgi:anti-sigma regulatory factor (Ser/Thr protein kinase)
VGRQRPQEAVCAALRRGVWIDRGGEDARRASHVVGRRQFPAMTAAWRLIVCLGVPRAECQEGAVVTKAPHEGDTVSRDGTMRATTSLPGTPPSIAQARDFTAAFVGQSQADPRIRPGRRGDALLVISELVTNVVRHAPGPCEVTLEVTGTELVITVCDTSTQPPTFYPPAPHRIGRHGLEIVLALCTSVDSRPTPQGKAIRAVMSLI